MMPTVEKRSLMQSSPSSSIVVSIPAGWLRWNGLKAKDKVEVICNDIIVIRPIQTRNETIEEIIKRGLSGGGSQS